MIVLIMMVAIVSLSMPPHSRIFDLITRGIIEVPTKSVYYGENIKRDYSGYFKAVVLFAEFPDQTHQVDLSFFNDLLNSKGLDFEEKYPISTNVSSVKEYYLFESNQTFQLDFDLYGWFEMPQPYDYYVGNNNGTGGYPNNSQKLVEDVIDLADSTVDFSIYDNDQDGTVDFLLVVHTGTGAEFSGTQEAIWSHMWSITPQNRDGVQIRKYSMQPEYWLEPNDMTIGVYCHELGHLIFGLPDLYDVNQSSYGIGYWGLMGGGSWNDEMSVFGNEEISGYGGAPAELTAWSKLKIGWYEVYEIEEEFLGTIEISPREIYKYTNPSDSNQYMLYEFKETNIYNQWLPGNQGLLIYRCDDSKYSNTQPWIPGERLYNNYKVAIMQKDN
ncbi:MAG: M6 family metalloprotease domain-containing protein [Bacteroidota bacterium]